ncbi:DNA repair protein [Candidatus Saccharibacteria bacterium]|nr:DNA repair protein [Candidatus Saccharibacteria bacterium]
MARAYLCIDLKSFYASVECVERGLDPMTTDLVVADPTRTEKTICLAVSPSLKQKGVKNRCRLFEIPKNLDYIIAPPRMQKYINYSARIYGIYLKYLSKDDIHVYSVDEAFLDVTDYLKLYQKTPREMAKFLIDEIKKAVGVNATAGVGTNLYLAKIAMDIIAKHSDDFIGELDEKSYREQLWNHRPLTDFWRIGRGISKNLEKHRIFTMGDIAHADEDILYGIFGKDAELLIDHAWGREPVTIADIKKYRPKINSFSSGQVLPRDYTPDELVLIVREMTRELCLRLTREEKLTSSITLTLGASKSSRDESFRDALASASHHFLSPTCSVSVMTPAVEELFWRIADSASTYRRLFLNCNQLVSTKSLHQSSLFELVEPKTDQKIQTAMLDITRRFGKNAIMRGEDLEEHATTRLRNNQIGGHRSA